MTISPVLICLPAPAFSAQACKPSRHVCSTCGLSRRPHFPSQEPPLLQQVSPALLRTHLVHPEQQKKIYLLLIVKTKSEVHERALHSYDTPSVGTGVVAVAEQAFMPSLHEYFLLPGDPQCPFQDPPLPQQVTCPLLVRPHFGHSTKTRRSFVFVDNMSGVQTT